MFPELLNLFTQGQGMMDPALGSVMAQDPNAVASHLAAQGIAPPPAIEPASTAPAANNLQGATAADADQGYSPAIPFTGPGGMIDRARQFYGPMVSGAWNRLTTMPPNPLGASPAAASPGQTTLQGATAADADQGYNPGTPPAPAPMPQPRPGMMQPRVDLGNRAANGGIVGVGPTDANAQLAPQGQQGDSLLKAFQGVKAPASPQRQYLSTPQIPRPGAMPNSNLIAQLLNATMGNAPDVKTLLLQRALYGGNRP